MNEVGLGTSCLQACIRVYIANRPPMEPYEHLENVKALTQGEIQQIAQQTGNHWRKIFNVYAKFLYSLYSSQQALAVKLHDTQRWQGCCYFRPRYLRKMNRIFILLWASNMRRNWVLIESPAKNWSLWMATLPSANTKILLFAPILITAN